MSRNHDQRISFQESPQRLVLRGFACVGEFFRARGGDFPLAKRAFIGSFFHELKENCGAEVTHHLEETKGSLADRNGWGVVGIYPTGGSLDDAPDGLLRLNPDTRGGRTMGSSQRELRHPTPGTRETLPWGDRLPFFRGLFFCLGLVYLS